MADDELLPLDHPSPTAFATLLQSAAQVRVEAGGTLTHAFDASVEMPPAGTFPLLYASDNVAVVQELVAALEPVASDDEYLWMTAGELTFRFADASGRQVALVVLLAPALVRCPGFYDADLAQPARLRAWLDAYHCVTPALQEHP